MKKTNLKTRGLHFVLAMILPIIFLLAWEYCVRQALVPSSLVASPTQVVTKFGDMLMDGRLFTHSYVSLKRLLLGFIIGSSLGIAVGTIVGFSRLGGRIAEPTLLALLPIPPIAWIPFLIIIFGIDEASKVALISIGSFWTLFLQTSYGIRTVDKNLVEVARIFKKSNATVLRKVMIPSCLPHIFSGMRVALSISWGLLVMAEIIASSSGLGWLIWDARNFSRPADLIVGMIVCGILGKFTDFLIMKAEKHATRWQSTYRDIH